MKKVLIIDDDIENLMMLSELLRGHFEPSIASSGPEGIQIAARDQPGAIVLDVNMPNMNGFEVCRKLKSQPTTRRIPVVMLTSVSAIESTILGFELGADDYIPKPFHSRELIARLNARMRRSLESEKLEGPIKIGNIEMLPKSFEVQVEGKSVRLTQLEFELLRYFIEHPDEVVDRSRLLGDLWPDSVVTDRTIDTHVANLRKKIKESTCKIQTIYGAGYMLRSANGEAAISHSAF